MNPSTKRNPESCGLWPDSPQRPGAAELRNRAGQRFASLPAGDQDTLSPEDIRRILHELRVHQIELEIQDEELRASREELEASRAR